MTQISDLPLAAAIGDDDQFVIRDAATDTDRRMRFDALPLPGRPTAMPLNVVNGGPDRDDTAGWTVTEGQLIIHDGPFFEAGDATPLRAYQDIALTDAQIEAINGGGIRGRVTWDQASFEGKDSGTLGLTYLDANGEVLADGEGKVIAAPSRGDHDFASREYESAIPAGTTTVRVTMHGVRHNGQNNNFDVKNIGCALLRTHPIDAATLDGYTADALRAQNDVAFVYAFAYDIGADPGRAYTVSGATISFKNAQFRAFNFQGERIGNRSGSGSGINDRFTQDFEFSSHDILTWNLQTNAIEKKKEGDDRSADEVILLGYVRHRFCYGWLAADLMGERIDDSLAGAAMVYTVQVPGYGNHGGVTVQGKQVIFNRAELYAFDKYGKKISSYLGPNGTSTDERITATFTVDNAQVLVWDRDTNDLRVQMRGDARTASTEVLLHYSRDRFCNGWLTSDPDLYPAIDLEPGSDGPIVYPRSQEGRAYVASCPAIQDMTFIGDSLLMLGKGDNNHGTATSYVYDRHTLQRKRRFQQNISHAAVVDYAPALDVLAIGNAGDGPDADAPRIDLIENASQYVEAGDILWDSSPRVSIKFREQDSDGNVIKHFYANENRHTANMVFADDPRTAYLLAGSENGALEVVQILLGTGDNDLSGGDNGIGDFISGRADNQYNGTARKIEAWLGGEFGTTQGAFYHGGHIYFGVSLNHDLGNKRIARVQRIVLGSDGVAHIDKSYAWPFLGADGKVGAKETEGVATDGTYLYQSTSQGDLVVMPLTDDSPMRGVATIGPDGTAEIAYLFACNSVPTVQITPTSAEAAGCYISAKSETGFTVAGTAGATFDWSAPIA